ncbi:MAG TPA: hypothetical protein VKK79_05065 [Candidatus Lokiarchaeia archaeon]|nr:hypothetical protein [Candidatus Lokiarchaeia archaeon]
MSQQRIPREGSAIKVDRRETKNGAPMLVLSIQLNDGTEERVSFFQEIDVKVEVAEGDNVSYNMYRRGNYINGQDLQVGGRARATPARVQQVRAQPSLVAERPPIHNLSAADLEALYTQVAASGQGEGAFLGQLRNQVRYARIEELLRELLSKIDSLAKLRE